MSKNKQKLSALKALKMTVGMFSAVKEAANSIGQTDSEFIREAIRGHLRRKHGAGNLDNQTTTQ